MDDSVLQRLHPLLNSEADWPSIYKAAHETDLAPLIHNHLKNHPNDFTLPDPLRASLRKEYLETTARNILFQDELVHFLKAFSKEGIDVIVLKGAALMNEIYPKIGLRPMGDLDLLIHREDLDAAEKIADSLGYDPDTAEDLTEDYSRRFRNEMTFIRRGPHPIRIEFHWQLLNFGDEKCSLADVWECSRKQSFDGAIAHTLSPEHQIVYLCEHLAYHHCLQGPLRYCDIAESIKHHESDMDWEKLISLARKSRSLPAVKAIFPILISEYIASIPTEVMQSLQKESVPWASAVFFKMATNPGFTTTAHALMDFRAIPGISRKLQFVAGKFFPSKECLTRRWPVKHPIFVYFLYIRRWFDMGCKGIRGILKLVASFFHHKG